MDLHIKTEESGCRRESCGASVRTEHAGGNLDFESLSDNVFDMKISTRSLVREFPKIKAAARKDRKSRSMIDGQVKPLF